MKKILFLGNPLKDYYGYQENELHLAIQESIKQQLLLSNMADANLHVLTNGNLGIPLWSGEIAMQNNINIHMYIPYKDMEMRWPHNTKKVYYNILKKARKKFVLSEESYSYQRLFEADQKMIDDADEIYTLFGTECGLKSYLKRLDKPVIDISPAIFDNYFLKL